MLLNIPLKSAGQVPIKLGHSFPGLQNVVAFHFAKCLVMERNIWTVRLPL